MVDYIGEKDSKRYEEFEQKCVNAYWALRNNVKLIVNKFYLMKDSGISELNNIEMLNNYTINFHKDLINNRLHIHS